MTTNWTDLSAFLSHADYNATPIDRHYGATEPLEALPCRCERPWLALDDGEVRCWKCGACPSASAATPSRP